MTYGRIIPGLSLHGRPAPYAVVNERSVRAAAGMMFVLGFSAFWYMRVTGSADILYVLIPLFWLEFFLKTVFQPHWSMFGLLADAIVRHQEPEYVGAVQKRFAWSIGLIMASMMVVLSLFLEIRGGIPLLICGTCLFFMFLESSCGICVGCNIYAFLRKKGWIPEPEHAPVCPGGACSIRSS